MSLLLPHLDTLDGHTAGVALAPGWVPLVDLLVERGCGEMLSIIDPRLLSDTIPIAC